VKNRKERREAQSTYQFPVDGWAGESDMSKGGRSMRALYKTTIVIWSEFDPAHVDLEDLAREATNGDAYCSKSHSEYIERPHIDADWGGTEFFGDDLTDDNSMDEATDDTHVD
jgi:hypothetical protein